MLKKFLMHLKGWMLKYKINQGVVMQTNIKQKCHSTGIFMNFKM